MKLLDKNLYSDLPNVLNFSCINFMSMNKSVLKETANIFNRTFNKYCYYDRFSKWFLMALDVIESEIYKPLPVQHKCKPPFNTCKIVLITKRLNLLIYQA